MQSDGGSQEIMGTFNRIIVVAKSARQAKKCIDAGFTEMRRIDSVMSDYKSDSELSKVNREAFAGPVKITPELFWIFQKSIEFSKLSDGQFDITVGPLVDLWHKAAETNQMPDENTIAQTKSRVGYEKLILDVNNMTVKFAVDGMRIDLGAIGKGYAVDKAYEKMLAMGAIAGMVDSGGNIRCFGRPLDKDAWTVGIQDPRVDMSVSLLVLKLNDMSVATSGDYQRFNVVAGQKMSHIIDTKTAKGAGKLASDTIICKTATDADGLSTTINLLGPDKGLALIESLSVSPQGERDLAIGGQSLAIGGPDTECILITPAPEYRIIKSKGVDAYISN